MDVALLALVIAHFVVAALLPLVSARWPKAAFGVAALVPAASLLWAGAHARSALDDAMTTTVEWAKRRFTAVLLVGVIGHGVGGLFVVQGAPDLALAQLLVETLSLIAFVLVLRRLPARFTERRSPWRVQIPKALIAALGGLTVAGIAVALSAARPPESPVSAEIARLAPTEAGAVNVVNAIIVDFRALDTLGEISVLFIAVAGVASLVLATPHDRRGRRQPVDSGQGSPQHEEDVLG